MTWMMLMPREIDLLMRPIVAIDLADDNENAALVHLIQGRIVGEELELTDDEMARVHAASLNFRLGYVRQLKAVLQAAERYP